MAITRKGIIFVLTLLTVFSLNFNANAGFEENEEEKKFSWTALAYNLVWYIPDVLLDLADCVSFEVGAGDIGVDLNLTQYAAFGAGVGNSYNVGWSHHRQIGFFKDTAYNANLVCLSNFEKRRENILGTHKNINCFNYTKADIIARPDNIRHEDHYAITAKIACYLGFKIQFHPVEFADFITGLFFYDLQKDSNQRPFFE